MAIAPVRRDISFLDIISGSYSCADDRLNLVGIGLVYSMQIIGMLQWAVRMVIETENSLTSVERLLAFNQIESETTGGLDEAKLPPNWPSDGAIEISNLKMRYRAGLPLVLNIEKLSIPGGCKVGVCGRTGAG